MKTILVACALFAIALGSVLEPEPLRIEEAPWQVSIQDRHNNHICGGTLILPNMVVTAHFCFITGAWPTVMVGSNNRKDGQRVKVKSILRNHHYNSTSHDNDIALLLLEEKLTLSDKVQTLQLTDSPPASGEKAFVTGWGQENWQELSEELHGAHLPVVTKEECEYYYEGLLSENMFCAGELKGGIKYCQGDIGGPLVVNNKLYGVATYTEACHRPMHPGVYTSVFNYLDWIQYLIETYA